MNIHHLKYFVALAQRSNYRKAAEYCHVSQPALSMAIKSLEEKLGNILIVRQKNPIELTSFGREILPIAERIIHDYESMLHLHQSDHEVNRTLRIGVIPTVAPYLIPKFLGPFIDKYKKVHLEIEELTTKALLSKLGQNELDAGILATPVESANIHYTQLYYEEFLAYTSSVDDKEYILPEALNVQELWLLEEGHCLRNQVINLCELQRDASSTINYHAGSIETLINIVNQYGGITIIPELAAEALNRSQKKKLKAFHPPAPVREISMAYHKYATCKPLINSLSEIISGVMPKYMIEKEDYQNIPIDSK